MQPKFGPLLPGSCEHAMAALFENSSTLNYEQILDASPIGYVFGGGIFINIFWRLSVQRVVELADQLCFPVPLAWMTCGSVDGLVPGPIRHYK